MHFLFKNDTFLHDGYHVVGDNISLANYQFHVDIGMGSNDIVCKGLKSISPFHLNQKEYDYEKQAWLETQNEIWRRTQTLSRDDWANTSAWRPVVSEFPIFHDYLMFTLISYDYIEPAYIPCEGDNKENKLMFKFRPYSSHACHFRNWNFRTTYESLLMTPRDSRLDWVSFY